MNKKLKTKTIVNRFKKTGKLVNLQDYLTIFWSQFQSNKKKWVDLIVINNSNKTQSEKLDLLRIMTEVKIDVPSFNLRKKRREGFNQSRNDRLLLEDKEQKRMFNLEDLCFICNNPPKHRHHIVQLQYGGRNIYKNIVHLCQKCHSNVHGRRIG